MSHFEVQCSRLSGAGQLVMYLTWRHQQCSLVYKHVCSSCNWISSSISVLVVKSRVATFYYLQRKNITRMDKKTHLHRPRLHGISIIVLQVRVNIPHKIWMMLPFKHGLPITHVLVSDNLTWPASKQTMHSKYVKNISVLVFCHTR